MPDPRDIVEIPGVENPARGMQPADSAETSARPWLGIFFRCCHVYGRIYRAPDSAQYVGRCPRCLSEVRARVGPGGTSRRIFFAQ